MLIKGIDYEDFKFKKYLFRTLRDIDPLEVSGFEGIDVETKYFKLKDNILIIKKDYAWNGCTMWFDTPSNLGASLPHDALYQAIKERLIPRSYRKAADKVMKVKMKADRANYLHYSVVYGALRIFGGIFANS